MKKLPGLGIPKRKQQFLGRAVAYTKAWRRTFPKRTPLVDASAKRQVKTAREILKRLERQKGVLLADDVGLGKTAIAVLVAAAFLACEKKVRILAPNDTMARRWREELDLQLQVVAEVLGGSAADRLKAARERLHGMRRLRQGNVQVTTHGRVRASAIECDLLIVDEAHRSRGEGSLFGQVLDQEANRYGRILLLTATPFSLNVGELARALRLVGAKRETASVARRFGDALERLWNCDFSRASTFGEHLGKAGVTAIRFLQPWVIRHAVDDEVMASEREQFGSWKPWAVAVTQADEQALETIVRADQLLSVAKKTGAWSMHRTNDPRFHQGYEHLLLELERLPRGKEQAVGSTHLVAQELHRDWLRKALRSGAPHPKVGSAVRSVAEVVSAGEKVLVFCDHLATASEMTRALSVALAEHTASSRLGSRAWSRAWRVVLGGTFDKTSELTGSNWAKRQAKRRCDEYVRWLSCPAMRSQVVSWMQGIPRTEAELVTALRKNYPRQQRGAGTIAAAARSLFMEMDARESRSTRAKLEEGAEALPGWGSHRHLVMSTVHEGETHRSRAGIFFPNEPDTLMCIFNSPFGPDVLVTTDRLSEGVDLHRSCRHIMHYELDPSPIRTIQRRGRLRRIGSWAAKTRMPLKEAFPAFRGTRDEALVSIMRRRLQQFGLLFGGVGEAIDAEGDLSIEEVRKQEAVLKVAKERLVGLSLALG